MEDQGQASIQDDENRPTYTEDASAIPSIPPIYEIPSELSPYCPFPPVMNAYCQWTSFKSFNICGANVDDRLYLVEMHTGYSGKRPLGIKHGYLLHNGMSKKDPILAAAGNESHLRAYSFNNNNNNSIILLPSLEPRKNGNYEVMTEEIMRASTSKEHGVVFRFDIEVGEKMHHESFEWRKMNKSGEDSEAKLVRLPNYAQSSSIDSSSSQGDCSSSSKGNGGEILALLTWGKKTNLTHIFTLQLCGSGVPGVLGQRWTLAVVITAIRLWALKSIGKANGAVIAMGEKIGPK